MFMLQFTFIVLTMVCKHVKNENFVDFFRTR